MKRRPSTFLIFVTATLAMLGAAIVFNAAVAAELKPADIAWIEKCVADRMRESSSGQMQPRSVESAFRKYCTCMQEIVKDNQPLDTTELERSYPPAHEMCWQKSRMP